MLDESKLFLVSAKRSRTSGPDNDYDVRLGAPDGEVLHILATAPGRPISHPSLGQDKRLSSEPLDALQHEVDLLQHASRFVERLLQLENVSLELLLERSTLLQIGARVFDDLPHVFRDKRWPDELHGKAEYTPDPSLSVRC